MLNVVTTRGVPGKTFKMTSTNAAQLLTAASIIGSTGAKCVGALITGDTYDMQYTFGGTTVVQGGVGHLLDVSMTCYLWLDSGRAVSSFQFISQASGSHGNLQITPFFEVGRS